MKGFAGIIALIAFAMIAIMFLGQTSNEVEFNTQNEQFLKTKMFIAQYEMVMTQLIQDCKGTTRNSTTNAILSDCVDGNSSIIFSPEKMKKYLPDTNCSLINPITIPYEWHDFHQYYYVKYQIQCKTKTGSENIPGNYFENSFKKIVKLALI